MRWGALAWQVQRQAERVAGGVDVHAHDFQCISRTSARLTCSAPRFSSALTSERDDPVVRSDSGATRDAGSSP